MISLECALERQPPAPRFSRARELGLDADERRSAVVDLRLGSIWGAWGDLGIATALQRDPSTLTAFEKRNRTSRALLRGRDKTQTKTKTS